MKKKISFTVALLVMLTGCGTNLNVDENSNKTATIKEIYDHPQKNKGKEVEFIMKAGRRITSGDTVYIEGYTSSNYKKEQVLITINDSEFEEKMRGYQTGCKSTSCVNHLRIKGTAAGIMQGHDIYGAPRDYPWIKASKYEPISNGELKNPTLYEYVEKEDKDPQTVNGLEFKVPSIVQREKNTELNLKLSPVWDYYATPKNMYTPNVNNYILEVDGQKYSNIDEKYIYDAYEDITFCSEQTVDDTGVWCQIIYPKIDIKNAKSINLKVNDEATSEQKEMKLNIKIR